MNHPKLMIIRGLPGSGKSTYAKRLASNAKERPVHVEADMYFETNEGYQFDRDKLGAAHEWCRKTVEVMLRQGLSVIVSNTFTTRREIEPYLRLAQDIGATVVVVRMDDEFESIHAVPQETINRMRERWDSCSDLFREYVPLKEWLEAS